MKINKMSLFEHKDKIKFKSFHATVHEFDTFKLGCIDLGMHFGTREQALNRIKHFKLDRSIPVYLLEVELDVGRILLLHEDVFYGEPVPTILRMSREETMFEPKNIFDCDEIMSLTEKYAPHLDSDIEVENTEHTVNDYEFYRELESFITRSGFDSIRYLNEKEHTEDYMEIDNYSWCLWDPSRIKILNRTVLTIDQINKGDFDGS